MSLAKLLIKDRAARRKKHRLKPFRRKEARKRRHTRRQQRRKR